MSDIRDAIYSILSADVTVAALVGTKIYPMRTPQQIEAPFMIYETTTNPTKIKNSASPLDEIELNIVIFSTTSDNGAAIDKAVRSALDRYSGTAASQTIQEIYFQDSRDLYRDEANMYEFDSRYKIRQLL